ncbi:MAG: NAD-dependent epimerase/dehydratase family protein [Planctomycetota bacterium]|jgi:nucleoside-diphosphate-sugar epimerase|nr:NAD-dependent epimerase/dehydratase family protein [Planctomycetota bacterium]
MRVLVTGGGGFLGSHIVDALLRRGLEAKVAGRHRYPHIEAKGVEISVGDLADSESALRAVDGCDAVIHTAAIPGIGVNDEAYRRSNIVATENVIKAAHAHGVRRLVFTSSPSVVHDGHSIKGGDETLPYPARYLTAYARTKAEAEKAILAANGESLSTCAIRPHLVFGPGDAQLIPKLLARARAGRLAQVGNGRNMISICYVENAADAHSLALNALAPGGKAAGQAYFVNEPDPVNCWEFINRIVTGAGLSKITRRVPYPLAYAAGWACETAYSLFRAKADPPLTRFLVSQLATSHWFKIDKARRDLGWEPAVSLDEGVRRFLDSIKKSRTESSTG